ncbi:thioesterase family protein, partial [bacterium]|nr:thioesterase family protein [bacterium]
GWLRGELRDVSEEKGWIRFREERSYDIFSLPLIVDAFPPAVFVSQGMVAWVPTIELTVSIRNIPETTWLKCVFRTRNITCGLLEEDGEVWDGNGRLAAVSRQIAQYRRMA